MSHPFYCRIVNGRPVMENPDGFQRLKESLEGKACMIRLDERPTLDDLTKCRGYFHKVVVPHIAKSVGYEPTAANHAHVKDGLKSKYLTIPTAPGEPIEVRHTESLSVREYSDFLFHCCHYAADELHDPVPDPI